MVLTLAVPAAELPRWDAPHHCGAYAQLAQTWTEMTRYGRAVWLVMECATCGRTWDVLSDDSDEDVIVAAVYPVFALVSCGLCCRGECAGTPDCCPCHAPEVTA